MFGSFFVKKQFQVVFIVSSPRSGSTWLSQALNAHAQIYCTENRLFGPHYDTIFDGPQKKPRLRITLDAYVEALTKSMQIPTPGITSEALQNRLNRQLANAILTLEHELSGKPILVDKFTPYAGTAAAAIGKLSETFPDAKFVHLYRDGRDVATSGVFHWLNKSTGESESEAAAQRKAFFLGKSDEVTLNRFFNDQELTDWATHWKECNLAMLALEKSNQVHRIRYRDMLNDHAGEMGRLLKFLGADSSLTSIKHCVEKSSFKVMTGGRDRGEEDPPAHVRKGVAGDWKHYFCRRDGEIFLNTADSVMRELGIEVRTDWINELPETLALTRRGEATNRAA